MGRTPLPYDDTGGSGPRTILLPGVGDVRSENRFLTPGLQEAGYRVVNADVPGCAATGATIGEAKRESRVAIVIRLEGLRPEGFEIPIPLALSNTLKWSYDKALNADARCVGVG
jgi:predicted RNase H-like HicB family nuclease